jgi:hypothetical protein
LTHTLSKITPEWKSLPVNRVEEHIAKRKASDANDTRDGEVSQDERISRAVKYLATLPPAVQGSGGSSATFAAARAVVRGFDLGPDVGLDVLLEHYNPRCVPAWSESELRRKCDEAATREFNKPVGWLLAEEKPKARIRPLKSSTQATTQPADPSGPPDSKTAPPAPVSAKPRSFYVSNYTQRPTEGDQKPERIGLTAQAITTDLTLATGGWPKRCRDTLFVEESDRSITWIESSTQLFGWIYRSLSRNNGMLRWARGDGLIEKAEYFEILRKSAESYEDVQSYPHHPEREWTYYSHPELSDDPSGYFDDLISKFSPASDADRYLIRAFFMTLVWGGCLGGRPIFVFEAQTAGDKPNQGSGKSTVTTFASKLFGGSIQISLAGAKDEDIEKRLLSPTARKDRFVVFDNLKGIRISSSLIESYVTAEEISGRQLYKGEGRRPNHLTWAITANQPNLSRDFSQRVVPIRILPPAYSPAWRKSVDRLINDHRWDIISDIVLALRADPIAQPATWSRWSEWESEVLCKVADPRLVMPTISERRADLDDDETTLATVRDAIAEAVRSKYSGDPEQIWCTIPPEAITDILKSISPYPKNVVSTCRWVAAIGATGLKRVRKNSKREWHWVGSGSIAETPMDWNQIPL